jgi:hypothetical protein
MKFNLTKFLAVLRQVGPIVLASVPGGDKLPSDLVETIVDAVGSAQQIKGATGAEKKKHVMAVVAAGVKTANATGKVMLDAAEVEAIASHGVDAVVGTVHLVDDAKAKVVKAPAA